MAQDKNASEQTLVVLALVAAAAGVLFVILGRVGHDVPDGYFTSHEVDGAKLAIGVSLIGLALTVWVLLLLFWAWRNERRYQPAYEPRTPTAQPGRPPNVAWSNDAASSEG